MPYPTKYTRQYDFQSYQVSNPTRPLPGNQVNIDLNAVVTSVDELVEFLKTSIRSDGRLANGSVGVNQLDETFNIGFSLPTIWEAGVAYTTDSTVFYANKFYIANVDHTSTDGFDESKWDLIVDFGEQATAAATSAAAALASQNAAASSATASASSATSSADSATAASNSATAASGSATTATTQATTAASSATAAAASASAAAVSADAAATSKTAAEAARDEALARTNLVAFTADRTTLSALDGATYQSVDLMEVGIKGTFQWDGSDLSAAVTADTRQAIYVAPATDTTGASGAWVRRFDGAAQFNWWRPAKDGTTDDTTVLNGAVDYVSSVGGKLIIPPGDYAIDGAVLKSNVDIGFMPGSRFIQPDAGSVTAGHVLVGTGTVNTGAAVTLTANASTGSASVTVAAGAEAAFAAGDYVLVYDDDYVFTPAVAGRNQEIMIVSSTSSGVVNFTRKLTTAVTTADNAKIAPIAPIENIRIHGPGKIIVGLNRQFGIRLTYPVGCRIYDGVDVSRPRSGGAFVFETGFDSHVYGVSARDGQVKTSGLGYGVAFDESCVFCSAKDSFLENLRENTFTNRTRWCVFEGNVCSNMTDTGWNCHGAGSDYNVCRTNTIRDSSQGVAVSWSGATRSDNFNTVEDNFIYRCTNGISLSGNSTGSISGGSNVVKGNRIQNCSGYGVVITLQGSPTIEGNEIFDSTSSVTGVYVVSNVSGANIKNNQIYDITGTSAIGIRVDNATNTNAVITGNSTQNITGGSALAFYVPSGSTGIRVHFNTLVNVAGGVSLAGATNTLNSWN